MSTVGTSGRGLGGPTVVVDVVVLVDGTTDVVDEVVDVVDGGTSVVVVVASVVVVVGASVVVVGSVVVVVTTVVLIVVEGGGSQHSHDSMSIVRLCRTLGCKSRGHSGGLWQLNAVAKNIATIALNATAVRFTCSSFLSFCCMLLAIVGRSDASKAKLPDCRALCVHTVRRTHTYL